MAAGRAVLAQLLGGRRILRTDRMELGDHGDQKAFRDLPPELGAASQPLNRFALIRNNLSLPHEADGHHAHSHNAKNDDETLLCFGNRNAKGRKDPRHGLGLLVLGRNARDPTRNAGGREARARTIYMASPGPPSGGPPCPLYTAKRGGSRHIPVFTVAAASNSV